MKPIKNLETENAKTICLEVTVSKKIWCIFFAYRPPNYNKPDFFDELSTSPCLILNKYNNIVLAGDLNIDIMKSNSDLSNYLSELSDAFNLVNKSG